MPTTRLLGLLRPDSPTGFRRARSRLQAAAPVLPSRLRMGRSRCGQQPDTVLSELDDLEGLSPEQLQADLAPAPAADTPLGPQHLANAERPDWAEQWASEMQHDVLE